MAKAAPLRRLITFRDVHRNVADPTVGLRACAVVATAAHTNRTVVFHDGGPSVPSDERRGIDYVPMEISEDHVRASAAIPVAFPAVEVRRSDDAAGWYFDGGTRLNTTIKAALKLGADRVIVLELNSVAPAPTTPERPDLFDGSTQIVQGLTFATRTPGTDGWLPGSPKRVGRSVRGRPVTRRATM